MQAPHRGASDEYQQVFMGEIKNNTAEVLLMSTHVFVEK